MISSHELDRVAKFDTILQRSLYDRILPIVFSQTKKSVVGTSTAIPDTRNKLSVVVWKRHFKMTFKAFNLLHRHGGVEAIWVRSRTEDREFRIPVSKSVQCSEYFDLIQSHRIASLR